MNNFKAYLIEQYVLGLIETMDIEGIGPVDCKIDSGNGAYNVLHGTNITYNGNETTFTTVNDVIITTSVIDKVTIHVGSGNIEERPVVQFNMTIGDQQLNDIKFSIADRSQNEYPVLVSKQFVEDLDALIDVSKNYITSTSVNESIDKELFAKQLKMGIKVEMEHTDDPKEAEKIARDHLKENPKYYSILKSVNL